MCAPHQFILMITHSANAAAEVHYCLSSLQAFRHFVSTLLVFLDCYYNPSLALFCDGYSLPDPCLQAVSPSLWMLGAVSPHVSQWHVPLTLTAASGFSWNFTSAKVEWEGGFCVLCRPHSNADTSVPCLHFSQQLTLLSHLQPVNDNNPEIYSYETAAWATVP